MNTTAAKSRVGFDGRHLTFTATGLRSSLEQFEHSGDPDLTFTAVVDTELAGPAGSAFRPRPASGTRCTPRLPV